MTHTSLIAVTLLILLLLDTNSGHPSNYAQYAGVAWRVIVEVYDMWKQRAKPTPIPLLIFWNDKIGKRNKNPVLWNSESFREPADMKTTPLQELRGAIADVLLGYPEQIDPNQCNLFYQHLGGEIPINSDASIGAMLELDPDFQDKYRQVFVRCNGIESCYADQCDANPNSDAYTQSKDNMNNIQYQLALDVYRHTKGHQLTRNEQKIEEYEDDLEQLGMDEFDIESHSVQFYKQDLEVYKERLQKMATAYGWNDKIQEVTFGAAAAEKTFDSDNKIVFKKDIWTLSGYVVRFAAFLTEDGKKISYSVTTSKFSFVIPEIEREQTFMQKYFTKGGRVSRKFARRITYLMDADAQKTGEETLYLPKIYFFE